MNKFYTIKTSMANSFLIESKTGEFLLIDTGMGGNYTNYAKKIAKLGFDISKVKYVLITHHHSDHTSNLKQLRDNVGAKLIAHKNEVPHLKNGYNKLGEYKDKFFVKLFAGIGSMFFEHSFSPVVIKDDDVIIEGDEKNLLKDFGIDGEILFTPGHTDGSISVLLSDGNAFVGDIVMNFFLSSPDPFLAENYDNVFQSWKKLSDNGAKIIHPAHGNSLTIEQVLSASPNL